MPPDIADTVAGAIPLRINDEASLSACLMIARRTDSSYAGSLSPSVEYGREQTRDQMGSTIDDVMHSTVPIPAS